MVIRFNISISIRPVTGIPSTYFNFCTAGLLLLESLVSSTYHLHLLCHLSNFLWCPTLTFCFMTVMSYVDGVDCHKGNISNIFAPQKNLLYFQIFRYPCNFFSQTLRIQLFLQLTKLLLFLLSCNIEFSVVLSARYQRWFNQRIR